MANEQLRQLQLTELEIFKEIVRICDKNGITYFLSGGTLLGAIRHKGFIPWDDDMDICLMRKDYDRLVEILPAELDEKYEYVDWNNEKHYGIAFSKVMKKNTLLKEHNNNKKNKMGIYVDIFPLDYICDDVNIEQKCCRKLYFYKRLMLEKCHYCIYSNFKKRVIYSILWFISLLYSKQKLIDNINKCIVEIGEKNQKYCYELADSGVGLNCVYGKYLSSDYASVTKVEFEGGMYNAPTGYENVLRSLYGDYMQFPKEEDRINYHNIEKLSFDTTKE